MSSPPPRRIGYSEFRCDDRRGQMYNWRTMRARIVADDATGRRDVGHALLDEPNIYTQFAGWSPDAKLAVIHRGWESDENYAWEREHQTFRMTEGWLLDVCVVDLATGKAENLTAVERVSPYNAGLGWVQGKPNTLAFTAMVGPHNHPFHMDRDGRNKRDLITGSSGFIYGHSPSPDGKRVAYHKDYQLFIGDELGANPIRVDTGHPFHFCPMWSPDGQWLLFLDGTQLECFPTLVRPDGTGVRRVGSRKEYCRGIETLDHPDFHSASSSLPSWSTDGQWVYYAAPIDGADEIIRMSLEGEEERLSRSKPGVTHYHIGMSPDGQSIVFGSTRDGARALYVARPDGSEAHPITTPTRGVAQMHARWCPCL